MHDGDAEVRLAEPAVDLPDRRVVPPGDGAEEDAGERLRRERDLTGHARQVHDRHYRADDRWSHQIGVGLRRRELAQDVGMIAGAEIDVAGEQPAYAFFG